MWRARVHNACTLAHVRAIRIHHRSESTRPYLDGNFCGHMLGELFIQSHLDRTAYDGTQCTAEWKAQPNVREFPLCVRLAHLRCHGTEIAQPYLYINRHVVAMIGFTCKLWPPSKGNANAFRTSRANERYVAKACAKTHVDFGGTFSLMNLASNSICLFSVTLHRAYPPPLPPPCALLAGIGCHCVIHVKIALTETRHAFRAR